MNANTQKFLQHLKTTSSFYQENKEMVDPGRIYEPLLHLFSDVFNWYKIEFEQSIEYITETIHSQASSRDEIEHISLKIRSTIKAYHLVNPMRLDEQEIDCLSQSTKDCSMEALKTHFQLLNKMFNPIKGALLNIGISSAMLKDLELKINELDTALPFDLQAIEAQKDQFNMASKAIQLLERLELEAVK